MWKLPQVSYKHSGMRSNFIHTCINFPSTFPQCYNMEHAKRMAAGGAWDRLPEEIVSLITIKVAETSEDPLQDLRSLQLCNKATKRVSSSRVVANHFNLDHHFTNRVWGEDDMYKYYQTVDWLQVANNGRALFVNEMSDICTSQPDGVALLTRAEEGDLQTCYGCSQVSF
jgi:hypothetical protein